MDEGLKTASSGYHAIQTPEYGGTSVFWTLVFRLWRLEVLRGHCRKVEAVAKDTGPPAPLQTPASAAILLSAQFGLPGVLSFEEKINNFKTRVLDKSSIQATGTAKVHVRAGEDFTHPTPLFDRGGA